MAGETVAICAPGPPLVSDLEMAERADRVVAAGAAAEVLRDRDMTPDWVVTDLDGHPKTVPTHTRSGTPVAIHAHGDNRRLLATVVPECALEYVLPTTQAEPTEAVRNFGGFTDGDRAAFFAHTLGADVLTFPGWDLTDETIGPEKRRKLRWAARLLAWLEHRRGETFDVLSAVRQTLDTSMLPEWP